MCAIRCFMFPREKKMNGRNLNGVMMVVMMIDSVIGEIMVAINIREKTLKTNIILLRY